MNKKLGIKIATFGVLFGVAFSCNDSFLDTKPFGAVTEELLSANESGADALLISAYSNLDGFSGWENGTPWGGAASNWTFGSVAGGDAYKGSEANDQPDVTPIERHETTANNPYVDGKWRNYYDGISRCNKAIKAFAALDIPAARKDLRLAEAKFLRGFYHLELRKVFGNVPYITEDLEDVRVGNDTDPMAKIQADLTTAIASLPVTQADAGRITKGAAQSYLGYTYLVQKDWAKAKAQFDAVIASGRYSLNAEFHTNFNAETGRNSPEGILEVQQAVNVGTDDNANNGDVLNYPYNGGPGGCCGFHQPSQSLVNSFKTDANGLPELDTFNSTDVKSDQGVKASDPFTPYTGTLDPRLDWTVGRRGIPYLDWGKHPGVSWIRDQLYGGPYAALKNVYYKSQENTLTTVSGWTKGYNANNTKLLRYADLLLMAAEAEVELGNLSKALDYVNEVRNRAANPAGFVMDGAVPAANYFINPYPSFPDAAYARKAVRFERKLELATEGHRFFDLVRWGIAKEEKTAYFAKEKNLRSYLNNAVFQDTDIVFPIPQKAITQSSKDGIPTIKQNAGY